jgi:hypothetical protein
MVHARLQSFPCSPSKDIKKIKKELEPIPKLTHGDMEREWFEDMCMLAAFTEFKRETAFMQTLKLVPK